MTTTVLAVVADPQARRVLAEAGAHANLTVQFVTPGPDLANTARPDVVVIDLAVREADAIAGALRIQFGPLDVPVVALAGFLSPPDPERLVAAGYATVLVQPITADRLAEAIRTIAASPEPRPPRPLVMLIDDDAINLRIARIRLDCAGFEIVAFTDPEEAVARAADLQPDAIVSDVLMPVMDGWSVCMAVRRNPRLAATPVVLLSANYVHDEDRALAIQVGATAFLERRPILYELIEVLRDIVKRGPRPVAVPELDAVAPIHFVRLRRQLDRVTRQLVATESRTALDRAALAILERTAETIARRQDIRSALPQLLGDLIESRDLTLAVLYLEDGAELHLQAAAGATFMRSGRVPPGAMCADLVSSAGGAEVVFVPGSTTDLGQIRDFLVAAEVSHALLCPLRLFGERIGVLLLGSETRDLSRPGWDAFAQTVSTQLALAIGLARAASAAQG